MIKRVIIPLLCVLMVVVIQQIRNTSVESAPKDLAESQLYSVSAVIDGDTITVSMDGKDERIRLLGIDTPETDPTYNRIECFGAEATTETKAKLLGKSVRIETDPSQATRDKYNRLLAYVFLDGQNFNEYLVRNGFAKEYTYAGAYKYQKEFRKAAAIAKSSERGLWSPQNCPTQK